MNKPVFLAAALSIGCSQAILLECDPDAAYADKATCDDGDPATADRCVEAVGGAVCASVRVQCDGFDPPDVQAARCDDGDPCTGERCLVDTCVHAAIGNGP
jgi:hypothetical protein